MPVERAQIPATFPMSPEIPGPPPVTVPGECFSTPFPFVLDTTHPTPRLSDLAVPAAACTRGSKRGPGPQRDELVMTGQQQG
jgi:hypothetical protein